MSTKSQFRVSKLYRYPVKSLGAEEIQTTEVCPVGFVGDRRYAIQEVSNGIICSAKVPKRFGILLEFTARYLSEPTHDGPLAPIEITFPDGQKRTSLDADINSALSEALGVEVRLISQADQGSEVDMMWRITEGHAATKWTEDRKIGEEDGQDKVRFKLAEAVPTLEEYDTFFDLSPIHLVTTSTINHFEAREPDVNFDPMRFRPNMVLEGPNIGLAEQEWSGKKVSFGAVALKMDYPTVRCGMPSLAQKRIGLETSRKTIQSIARHNTLQVDALGPGNWACAGAYASVVSLGKVSIGEEMLFDTAT